MKEIVEFGDDEVSLRSAEIGEGHEFVGTLALFKSRIRHGAD